MRQRIGSFGLLVFLAACPGGVPGSDGSDGGNPLQGSCGDGNVDAVEACDDGNSIDTDACTTTCDLAVCGDGFVHEGVETCDDGNTEDADACIAICQIARCGDGVLRNDLSEGDDGYEVCDDGNTNDADDCTQVCDSPRCGDGLLLAASEACDDGNDDDTDACLSNCAVASCGDGFARVDAIAGEAGYEACDDGNDDNTDACTTTCVEAVCGDGFARMDLRDGEAGYEACDDGNDADTDACLTGCVAASCGDGQVWEGEEECDDGNLLEVDSCRNNCARARCGDGVLREDLGAGDDGFEVCDDGNVDPADACTDSCAVAVCGDGIARADLAVGEDGYEVCDDGNRSDRDACLNTCIAARCGDEIIRRDIAEGNEGHESCDDGNQVASDACSNACQRARCGDGIRRVDIRDPEDQRFEECDDGNADAGDGCTSECVTEIIDILPGAYHACALKANGDGYCWGRGTSGELGGGAFANSNVPRRLLDAVWGGGVDGNGIPRPEYSSGFSALALGAYFSCGITVVDGRVACWGTDGYGQRGDGNGGGIASLENYARPWAGTGLTGGTSIAAGSSHACAIAAGRLQCWGRNHIGQLGIGSRQDRSSPVSVGTGYAAYKVYSGAYYSCVTNGPVTRCWGANGAHNFDPNGEAPSNHYTRPIRILAGLNITNMALGDSHMCITNVGGAVNCFGSNLYHQVDGSMVNPQRRSGAAFRDSAALIGAGTSSSCAVRSQTGATYCWGRNQYGQIGNGQLGGTVSNPATVQGGSNVIKLAVREYFGCALNSQQQVKCWGRNRYGQLGVGDNDDRRAATLVEFP
jgi:cysteine-rich repeat protein